MPRRGLGRGLDALIPAGTTAPRQSVLDVRVEDIEPNPYQPRADMPDETLQELVESVRQHGIIQPLLVRRMADGYQILAGERRWRAAMAAGLTAVPCLLRDATDEQTLALALVENLQREDLSAPEAAHGYKRLMDEFELTQTEVADIVGKSRSAVANTLRLLRLPGEILASLQGGRIAEGHARALLSLDDEKQLFAVWRRVEDEGLTVRATERLCQQQKGVVPDRPRAKGRAVSVEASDPHYAEAAERIQRALGTKTTIRRRATGGGHISIEFYDASDLTAIVETIEGQAWSSGHRAKP